MDSTRVAIVLAMLAAAVVAVTAANTTAAPVTIGDITLGDVIAQLEKAEASAAEKGIETMTGEELVKEFEAAGVAHVRAVQTAVRTLEVEEDAGVTRGGKKRRTSLAAA